jgi:hypothetical protein
LEAARFRLPLHLIHGPLCTLRVAQLLHRTTSSAGA